MEEKIPIKNLYWLLGSNLVLVILLGVALFNVLEKTEAAFIKTTPKTATAHLADSLIMRDSILLDSLNKIAATTADSSKRKALTSTIAAIQANRKPTSETGVTFYLIIQLMLISGSLGGILCNLRGFFMHYRSDKQFPAHLEIPYYVRPFMGAGAGLFIYFVANLLITSITTEYRATNIPFQGMVSFIALSMLAGFGSLEFFQRLKETALTFFGQKAEKDKWQKIEDLYGLHKKGVITEAEFNVEKAKLLANSSDLENALTLLLAEKSN